MADVVIIHNGGANLASLQYALERLGAEAPVSSDPAEISRAKRIILPGVGSATDAMQRLRSAGIADLMPKLTQPVLGICLGMQLLFEHSEEGETPCLGVLPGTVKLLEAAERRPVPHMGWNQLAFLRDDPLLTGIEQNDYAYFVHSYAAPVSDVTVSKTEYGQPLSAIVRRGNFWGTQFHPERSGRTGARILSNFLKLT